MQEITLRTATPHDNYYEEVTVWIELTGPDLSKRIYGFWDGDNIFKVRFVATQPEWKWVSGSNRPADAGLNGKTGQFTAIAWTGRRET